MKFNEPSVCRHLVESIAGWSDAGVLQPPAGKHSTHMMTGSINRSDVSIQCRSSVSSVDFLTLQNFYLHKNASKHTKGKQKAHSDLFKGAHLHLLCAEAADTFSDTRLIINQYRSCTPGLCSCQYRYAPIILCCTDVSQLVLATLARATNWQVI